MANEYLKRFKTLFSSGDSKYTIATRTHFFVSFTFPTFISGTFNNINSDNLGYLVQSIDVPNFVIRGNESEGDLTIKNNLGAFRIVDNTTFLPENSNFTITFLDTEEPIFEGFFYPWMKQVTSSQYDKGSSNNVSRFPRANVIIELYDNQDERVTVSYRIEGAFPIHVDAPTLSYTPETNRKNTRSIVFAFNEVDVKLGQIQTVAEKDRAAYEEAQKKIKILSDQTAKRNKAVEAQFTAKNQTQSSHDSILDSVPVPNNINKKNDQALSEAAGTATEKGSYDPFHSDAVDGFKKPEGVGFNKTEISNDRKTYDDLQKQNTNQPKSDDLSVKQKEAIDRAKSGNKANF